MGKSRTITEPRDRVGRTREDAKVYSKRVMDKIYSDPALLQEYRAYQKEYRTTRKQENPAKYLLTTLLAQAKRRSILRFNSVFDLTLEWVFEQYDKDVCAVTGIPFRYTGDKDPYQPSIDRIDSSKGYTQDNCQLVVLVYNYAKNEWSGDDVLDFCYQYIVNKATE